MVAAAFGGAACGGGGGTLPGPDAGAGVVHVTPATADVLTCSTRQFTTDDTAATPGTWSVDRGTIAATGLYSSPLTVPATPEATVSYAPVSGAPAHATAHLATAFPAAPAMIDTAFTNDGTPSEHVVSARGMRAYAVFPASGGGVRVLRSDDGGATFTAKPTLAIGGLTCATAAIDAGNPDVLYVVAHHASGSETSVTLRVSEDGGATFPATKSYTIADSVLDGLPLAICPDVVSPSPDHVVVSTAAQDNAQTMSWTALYVSADRGASFGNGVGTNSNDYYVNSDVNPGTTFQGTVLSDGGQNGPRVFADGTGHACTTYAVDSATGCTSGSCISVVVQCSSNGGASWTAPRTLAVTGTKTFPTGAISPHGDIAVSWTEIVGSDVRIKVAFSHDAGATFSAAVTHPLDLTVFGYTAAPIVQWEGGVLWLAQTTAASDNPVVVIDKTCDFGTSWSGALPITQGSDFLGEALMVTSSGVRALARGLRDTAGFPLAAIALTP